MDLVDFVRGRLDEDEAGAVAASGPKARYTHWDLSEWYGREEPSSIVGQGTQDQPLVLGHFTDPIDNTHANHIARHDPARVLRDVDSSRRTLVRCQEEMLSGIPRLVHFARMTVWEMASRWSDHKEFCEDWRP